MYYNSEHISRSSAHGGLRLPYSHSFLPIDTKAICYLRYVFVSSVTNVQLSKTQSDLKMF
jgi:hypothetical protein